MELKVGDILYRCPFSSVTDVAYFKVLAVVGEMVALTSGPASSLQAIEPARKVAIRYNDNDFFWASQNMLNQRRYKKLENKEPL